MFRLCHIFGVVAVLAIFGLQSSEGCSCLPSHPQDNYCKSQFVILAVPTKRNDNGELKVSYDIKIITVFKASPEAKTALQSNKVYTASNSAACGVGLQLNETYVLMGGVFENRASIGLCGYNRLWKDVPDFQKQGIKTTYQKGCTSCNITTCFGSENCEKTKTNCVYDFQKSPFCYSDHSACIPDCYGCNWTKSPALTKCLNDAEKTVQ